MTAYNNVSDNKIIAGKHNRMGEFGHMVIRPNGKKCFCGQNGCFECYVSARRLSKDLNDTVLYICF